jgi:hypothetical protein
MAQIRWNTKTVPDGTQYGQDLRVLEYFDGTDWQQVPEVDSRPLPQPLNSEPPTPHTAEEPAPQIPAA